MYIVIYNDCSMIPLTNAPDKTSFQEGAKCYKVDSRVTLFELSDWYCSGSKDNAKFKPIW